MRSRGLFGGGVLWLGLAAHSPSAFAQEARTPAVWYRAAAECPLGPDFLAKIDGTPRAHLALAGEHIDFIVTLLTSGNETVGRLERQTNGGTVAIRELRDATCERVADGLALSLGLALDPTLPSAPSAAEPATPEPSSAQTAAPTNAPVEIAEPLKPAPVATAPPAGTASRPTESPANVEKRRAWWLGLAAGLLSGPATRPMPRGTAFVDLEHALPSIADNLSLRVALVGALGSSKTELGTVQRWVLGGRAEVSPLHIGSERIGLRPCLAFELGATGASSSQASGVDARSLWAAPG
ncbi:MAG TPA: hypothetical protein VGF76_16670, partial [Polyangiaceae bacterium]